MKSNFQRAAIVIFAITIFGMLSFASIVYADDSNQNNSVNQSSDINETSSVGATHAVGPQSIFNDVNLVGKGLAISTTNSSDVHIISIAVAKVDLTALIRQLSQYVTLPSGIPSVVDVGVFHFDNTMYKLTNINVTNSTVTADIDSNGTTVGSINLAWTIRANRILWLGNLTLNGNNYNAYVLEGQVIGVGHQCGPGETDDMSCRAAVVQQCGVGANTTAAGCGEVEREQARFQVGGQGQIHLPPHFENEGEVNNSVNVTQGIGVNTQGG